MHLLSRRALLAVAGTLASTLPGRKPFAAETLPAAELDLIVPPVRPPEIVFTLADGTDKTLAEFRGHGMVINFWATWCAPCVAEMPALEKLSRTLAPFDIAVMPLSSDRGGAAAVRRFYAARDISGLPVLLDPKGAAARQFDLRGIPSTIIINKAGAWCARLDGAADWSPPAVASQIRRLVG